MSIHNWYHADALHYHMGTASAGTTRTNSLGDHFHSCGSHVQDDVATGEFRKCSWSLVAPVSLQHGRSTHLHRLCLQFSHVVLLHVCSKLFFPVRRRRGSGSAISPADFLGLERRFAGAGLVLVVIGGSTIDSCTGAGACSSLCVVGSCSGLRVRTRSSALLGFGQGSAPMFCSSWSPLSISPCERTNTGTSLSLVSCSAAPDHVPS